MFSAVIGIGDFSHGDDNIWKFRLHLLKKLLHHSNKKIVIFNEDYPYHSNAIMNIDKKLSYYKNYGLAEGKYAYGPISNIFEDYKIY